MRRFRSRASVCDTKAAMFEIASETSHLTLLPASACASVVLAAPAGKAPRLSITSRWNSPAAGGEA